jgi:hypothetical protein
MTFIKKVWSKFLGLKLWQKILTVLLLVSLFGAMGGSGSTSTDSSSTKTTTEASAKPTADSGPALGTTAADGKFAFVIWKIKCGVKSVGSGFTKSTAQGSYCLVDMSVKNIGNEAQTIFSDNMKLIDAQGREFQTDSGAMMFSDNQDLWLKEINPGIQIDGQLIFDLPADAKPVTAELHDSAFSGGVKIDLTRKDPAYKG